MKMKAANTLLDKSSATLLCGSHPVANEQNVATILLI